MRACLNPIAAAALAWLVPLLAGAQVRTDGSLGGPARALSGPTYAITEDLGRRAGNNLFHSFETFRIGSGERALFSTSTPTIANVFSRVTGGEVSTINGTVQLQAAAGAPALFLINPAGVVFGAGAVIDVPGAFHVSTADSVRFADGVFHADPARASTFSSAPPEAFGFLGDRRGAVVVQGAQLSTGNATLSIVAGDVTLTDGASVRNRGGDLSVVAVGAQAAQVSLQGDAGPLGGTVRIEGKSFLQTEASEDMDGGAIRVAAGRIEIAGMEGDYTNHIRSETRTSRQGGMISLRADDALELSSGGTIGSYASGAGAGGHVRVSAGSMSIDDQHESGTAIYSTTYGSGAAGDVVAQVTGDAYVRGAYASIRSRSRAVGGGAIGAVRIGARNLRLEDGAEINSDGYETEGGAVSITAENLSLDSGSSIASSGTLSITAVNLALTAGGNIESRGSVPRAMDIEVNDTVRVVDGSRIRSDSGGAMHIRAREVLLDQGAVESRISGSAGEPARLAIRAREGIELRNGSRIEMSTSSDGGDLRDLLELSAGRLLLDGSSIQTEGGYGMSGSGGIQIAVAGEAELRNQSLIATRVQAGRSSGQNPPGDIALRAGALSIHDSVIESISGSDQNTGRGGGAGNVTLNIGGRLLVTNSGAAEFSGIRTWQKQRPRFKDPSGGGIVVRAGQLHIQGDAAGIEKTGIVATTEYGVGRDLDIDVREGVSLRYAILKSEGRESGDGGAIRLKAGTEIRLDDSDIDTSTWSSGGVHYGWGRSGSIDLEANAIHLTGSADIGTRIRSEGTIYSGTGGAGSVRMMASGPITMRGNARVSTYSYTYGGENPDILVREEDRRIAAGHIDVQAGSLLMENGASMDSSTASDSRRVPTGHAGSISVQVGGAVELWRGSDISTIAFGSEDAGDITVRAANLLIDRDADPRGTGLFSDAWQGSSGNAGRIDVQLSGQMDVRGGGNIASSALGSGGAGSIQIRAADVRMSGVYTGPVFRCSKFCWADGVYRSGIEAVAFDDATGTTGNVSVTASHSIVVEGGAHVVTQNQMNVAPGSARPVVGLVHLSAPVVALRGYRNALNATATGNVGAGNVQVDASSLLLVDNSRIVTSALGAAGDGGNIRINAPVVALNTGFVQANATAPGATGGNIEINVRGLLPSHGSLQVGGDAVASFEAGRPGSNVIQAVAPTGVSGNIQIASPALDIAGTLKEVDAEVILKAALGKSPCQRTGGSSLALAGRGGLPPSPSDPAGVWSLKPVETASVGALSAPVGVAGCAGS